jgi:hypothetical protein
MPPEVARLAAFDVGDRLWVLSPGDQPGLGEPATVTGLAWHGGTASLTYRTGDGREGQEYRPMSLADARARFWITDADRTRIVGGGWPDELRTARVQAERFPGCVVAPGTTFVPADIDRDAVSCGDTVTYHAEQDGRLMPAVFAGTVEYTTADAVHVVTDTYRYAIAWHRLITHTPRAEQELPS